MQNDTHGSDSANCLHHTHIQPNVRFKKIHTLNPALSLSLCGVCSVYTNQIISSVSVSFSLCSKKKECSFTISTISFRAISSPALFRILFFWIAVFFCCSVDIFPLLSRESVFVLLALELRFKSRINFHT